MDFNMTVVPKKVFTAEEYRKLVLAHALEQSHRYRMPAERESPFAITEREWAGFQHSGKPFASYTLNIDGTYERREYDGKGTHLNFAIAPGDKEAMVFSGGRPLSCLCGRGFMVQADGSKGFMWIS